MIGICRPVWDETLLRFTFSTDRSSRRDKKSSDNSIFLMPINQLQNIKNIVWKLCRQAHNVGRKQDMIRICRPVWDETLLRFTFSTDRSSLTG